jgi:hypothetical protein
MSLHTSLLNIDWLSELVVILDLLPAHDPNRFESLDGHDDPNTTNAKRAAFTIDALAAFQKTRCMSEELNVAVADLICDLLHFVHALEYSPKDVLENALTHFIAEAG